MMNIKIPILSGWKVGENMALNRALDDLGASPLVSSHPLGVNHALAPTLLGSFARVENYIVLVWVHYTNSEP